MGRRPACALGLLLVLSLILGACGGAEEQVTEPHTPAVTRIVTEVVVEEGELVEVTRIVSEEVVVSTPGPAVTREPAVTEAIAEEATEPLTLTPLAAATRMSPTAVAPTGIPLPTPVVPPPTAPAAGERLAELEWPPRMRLGDSDVVRLSILPVAEGYEVITEFPDHRTVTGTLTLEAQQDYDLVAAARLDGVGFTFSPQGEQPQDWRPAEPMIWRWTISPERSGQQRLAVVITLRWLPLPGNPNPARQAVAFSRSLNVQVTTLMGMTSRQLMLIGAVGAFVGLILNLPLVRSLRREESDLDRLTPNPALILEPHPEVRLEPAEERLLQALFRRYDRLTLESEFLSGYSGARTFLARPIRADGRADAFTIAKLGGAGAMRREYDNYRRYVEHTLPPVTARIQDRPATVKKARLAPGEWALAALRYTFIGEPGQKPVSLRERLLEDPDPAWLERLCALFGSSWWMQRRPYTFRLLQEYDRKLPSHYVLRPTTGEGQLLDGARAPGELSLAVGDVVRLRHVRVVERKEGGRQLSLRGETRPGQAPLRLRWLSPADPEGATARVVATRDSLLAEWTAGFDLLGRPDPLAALPGLLNETVSGGQSTIHGDLNLENIIVGPGESLWLIDFASTRDGHALFDLAHLAAELVAHVLPAHLPEHEDYLAWLESGEIPLLAALENIAGRCLFNPDEPREFTLAWTLSCLGALKHGNLNPEAKYRLYLTAAHLTTLLEKVAG